MIANQIGYYSLILGLLISVLICGVSIKDFNNNKQISQNTLSLSFLQLVFVIVSFSSLILSFINSSEVNFIITDFKNEINVVYSGAVPNLFTEGKGVIAEGFLKDKNYFKATKILAKHDENYMPPEVKEAIGDK